VTARRNASGSFLRNHMSERVAFRVFTREIMTNGQRCVVGNPLTGASAPRAHCGTPKKLGGGGSPHPAGRQARCSDGRGGDFYNIPEICQALDQPVLLLVLGSPVEVRPTPTPYLVRGQLVAAANGTTLDLEKLISRAQNIPIAIDRNGLLVEPYIIAGSL
jgi:hypothetical protein